MQSFSTARTAPAGLFAGRAFSRLRSLAVVMVLVLATFATSACSGEDDGVPSDPTKDTFAASLNVDIATMTKKANGLYVKDIVTGTGSEAIAGRTLKVFYTGYLPNAQIFDSNIGKGVFTFQLGVGQVIKGWDIGVSGMRVGGKRKIVLASALGYGSQVNGTIPANSTLVFDVELTSAQ